MMTYALLLKSGDNKRPRCFRYESLATSLILNSTWKYPLIQSRINFRRGLCSFGPLSYSIFLAFLRHIWPERIDCEQVTCLVTPAALAQGAVSWSPWTSDFASIGFIYIYIFTLYIYIYVLFHIFRFSISFLLMLMSHLSSFLFFLFTRLWLVFGETSKAPCYHKDSASVETCPGKPSR